MDITVLKELKDNRYSAEFSLELTDQEADLAEKFGEPSVNVGGSFTGPPAFTLADDYHNLPSGFPVSLSIDANGDPEAKDKMNVWITEVKTRLTSAKNTLVSQTDDFSGKVIETV